MEVLSIGGLAESAGVNVETVRYYERRGLMAPRGSPDVGGTAVTACAAWR